jgi:hypothetical protein
MPRSTLTTGAAVTFGEINRLLINVPPGFMKSLLVNVFWPAWEWGPMNMPHLRYLAFSYALHLTMRDNDKLVRLVTSPRYRELWGDRFEMVKIGAHKPENDHTGYEFATSIEQVSGVKPDGRHSVACSSRRPSAHLRVTFNPPRTFRCRHQRLCVQAGGSPPW